MNVRKLVVGTTAAAALTLGAVAPATAQTQQTQRGGAVGGLVAAVVQAQVDDVEVITVTTGDINVALTNVLNNNRILTDILNDNNVVVTDVVDVAIVDNILIIRVLS